VVVNKAAIILTDHAELDVTSGWGYGKTAHYERVPASEQLLADLRTLVTAGERYHGTDLDAQRAAARVRTLLPEEEA
jgi:hypothetical protein